MWCEIETAFLTASNSEKIVKNLAYFIDKKSRGGSMSMF